MHYNTPAFLNSSFRFPHMGPLESGYFFLSCYLIKNWLQYYLIKVPVREDQRLRTKQDLHVWKGKTQQWKDLVERLIQYEALGKNQKEESTGTDQPIPRKSRQNGFSRLFLKKKVMQLFSLQLWHSFYFWSARRERGKRETQLDQPRQLLLKQFSPLLTFLQWPHKCFHIILCSSIHYSKGWN